MCAETGENLMRPKPWDPNQQHRQATMTRQDEKSRRTKTFREKSSILHVWAPIFLNLALNILQGSYAQAKDENSWLASQNGSRTQADDLVAIGAASLLASRSSNLDHRGRLTERIAFSDLGPGHPMKLDYIVDFMKANKLTKFCDLLTGQRGQFVSRQLNQMKQFTLFVPTNEALLLMPSDQLERIKVRPDELAQFLLSHATSDLVVPRLNMSQLRPVDGANETSVVSVASTSLVYSLSGSPLRISTLPVNAGTQSQPSDPARLELIVNGANVLPGQSYALQEPNNLNATHAVVHLIDRSLFPPPTRNLLEQARLLAPTMSSLIGLARDSRLTELLESTRNLTTLFLPNEDAFRATSPQLLDKLHTNQTFLLQFLRSHLLEGLHFSGRLAAGGKDLQASRPFVSLGGEKLELDFKNLQGRQLVLVNSVPIVAPDLMASNGVAHVLNRALFPRHLIDDCNCGSEMSIDANINNSSSSSNLERESDNRSWPAHFRTDRSHRSFGSLPIGPAKDRNFYRPSLTPANLQLSSSADSIVASSSVVPAQSKRRIDSATLEVQDSPSSGWLHPEKPTEASQTTIKQSGLDQIELKVPGGGYQVTLNASSRLRMRAEQQRQLNQFSYDQPLLTTSATLEGLSESNRSSNLPKRSYSSATVANKQERLSLDESSKREQRLLRFEPEDARDSPAARLANPQAPNVDPSWLTNSRSNPGPASSNLQPAYDMVVTPAPAIQNRSGKTSVAPVTSLGCAFYDVDCRRLMGRLVRLPSRKVPPLNMNRTSSFEATFGETSSHDNIKLASSTGAQTTANMHPSPPFMGGRSSVADGRYLGDVQRVSALNQRLPPINSEDTRAIPSWRFQETTDLARLSAINHQPQPAHGFTSGISRQHNLTNSSLVAMYDASSSMSQPLKMPQQEMRQAQILLVPVKIVKEAGSSEARLNLTDAGLRPTASILLVPSSSSSSAPSSNSLLFNARQYQPPTHHSSQVSPTLTDLNLMSSTRQRSNISSGNDASDGFEWPMGAGVDTISPNFNPQQPDLMAAAKRINPQIPVAPMLSHRKQQQQQQMLIDPQQLGTNFQSPAQIHLAQRTSNVKWPTQNQQQPTSDISITSARLVQRNSSGLATQASNQQPQVGQPSNGDFFQDRTIAEIMDDSGLRIDDQLVTFKRLKRCLEDANLLSLASQTGNSLTIFMPTDQAFQRLVQHALAVSNQHRLRDPALSHRLQQSPSNHIPLLVRAQNELSSDRAEDLRASQLDRLNLDCQTPQARQLLLDHISARFITPRQLVSDMSIASLSGKQLILSSVPSKQIVVVDGQPVLAATQAKNGMVYVINKFLNTTNQMPNVLDLMESQPDLSTFASYLKLSSMAERLKRETGPLTILAPTNDAFDQLSPAARQLMNSDPAALMDILRGHIIEGAQYGKLISMRSRLRTMNADQNIEAKVIKPNIYMLDNQMTSMRLVGTSANGVVNAIDRLVVPSWLRISMGSSRSSPTSSAELLASSNRQSNRSNLPMIGDKPIRFEQPELNHGNADIIFRNSFPRNFAGRDDSLMRSPGDLRTSNSSIASSSSSDLFSGNEIQSNSGANMTKNLQLIQKLTNLMQTKKFLKLLHRSKVYESLKPDMNYVILVPTDKALERLPPQITSLLERDMDRLSDLVNYHILDTTFEYINTIPDGQTLQTLNEKDILFNWHRNNTILTVSGAVVLGGIQEDNIALLIVDRVLYPTPGDLLSIVIKSPILSNFTSIIKNAGLESLLTRAGPYTLFAPSDLAFNQLERADLDFLNRNKDIARRFLHRHLTSPMVFTSSIALSTNGTSNRNGATQSGPSMSITNSLGEDLTLRQQNDFFSVNDINFSYADVAATNGVVHVIDGLL